MSNIDFLVKLRDAACMIKDACEEQLEKMAPAKLMAVKEEVFNILKFEAQKGEKLGEFETADKRNSAEQNWNHAFDILKSANAGINARYHGSDYVYSYWLYKDRVFRQKLKEK
jgi:hypothetical protein